MENFTTTTEVVEQRMIQLLRHIWNTKQHIEDKQNHIRNIAQSIVELPSSTFAFSMIQKVADIENQRGLLRDYQNALGVYVQQFHGITTLISETQEMGFQGLRTELLPRLIKVAEEKGMTKEFVLVEAMDIVCA
jgi:hypothetical protein